ncbi:hypothetical protein ACWCQJ_22525, partial [Streptomyces olivaceus]
PEETLRLDTAPEDLTSYAHRFPALAGPRAPYRAGGPAPDALVCAAPRRVREHAVRRCATRRHVTRRTRTPPPVRRPVRAVSRAPVLRRAPRVPCVRTHEKDST